MTDKQKPNPAKEQLKCAGIKERLIRMIQASDEPLTRRALITAFDSSRQDQASQHLSDLLGSGYVLPLGSGRRGSPVRILRSKTWPFACPLCGHAGASQE